MLQEAVASGAETRNLGFGTLHASKRLADRQIVPVAGTHRLLIASLKRRCA